MNKEEQFILTVYALNLALNLAACDIVKQSNIMRNALDTTFKISKLLEFSPKHDSRFEKLKQELTPNAFPRLDFCVFLEG